MVSGARTLIPLEQPAEVARLVTDFYVQLAGDTPSGPTGSGG
jgi:hypothetical protein